MSKQRLDPLSEQTIDWMVKLRAGTPDAVLQERFNAWLAKDPAHAQAWEQLHRRLGGSFKTLRTLEQRIPGQADEARQLLLQPTASRRDALRAITGLGLLGGGLWLGASTPLGDSLLADLSTGRDQRQDFNLDGEQMPLSGDATLGKGLNIGYFAQHQVEMLRHDESPLWHLSKIAPTTREQELRNFLGGFNFPGNMVTSSIAPFSGGEKARLALALIVWQRPNLLLLDEPTNHLDLETREALTEALAQFEGTLVVVSHDRHLLRATTDEFIIVADGKLQPFDGDLDDYKDWLFKTKLGKGTDVLPAAGKANKTDFPVTSSVPSPVAAAPAPAAPVRDKRKEAEERQKTAALRKPIENKIKRQEEQIAKRNAQKAETDAKLGEPSIYDAANKAKLKQLLADQTFFTKDLAQLEAEWLELQDQLEKLG